MEMTDPLIDFVLVAFGDNVCYLVMKCLIDSVTFGQRR